MEEIIISAIKDVGFPIVACLLLIWVLHKALGIMNGNSAKFTETNEKFIETLTTHTEALKDLSEFNKAELSQLSTMVNDIQIIKETVVRLEKRPCQIPSGRKLK